jgi:imidazolonepropionase-like amidohydrolase
MNRLLIACTWGLDLLTSVQTEQLRTGAVSLRSVRRALLVVATLAGASLRFVRAEGLEPFAPPQAGLVLFRDATLIDGTGGPERAGMDVLVDGERIEKVFPDTELDPGLVQKAKVVPLAGRFLMPGLIDAHVHLATPPNRRHAEALLRRDLYGGVTAVRDMADDLRAVGELARASLVGEIAGPDIYYAALMAGPDFFTDKRTIMVSAGGVPGHVPWMQAIVDDTDLHLAVAQARGTSATAIKLYADLSPELATKITTEAHRQDMLVWAHATLFPAKPSEVVAAGVDVISHACLLTREPEAHLPSWKERPRKPSEPALFLDGRNPDLAALFTEMIRRKTILDPTIWVSSTCEGKVAGAITGQAYRAGVLIDAGTDHVADWSDPWPDLFHELAEMTNKAGMPNSAVLQSATLISARAAGQQQDMGSIEPGKLANLVVLASDPVADLGNLRSVITIVKRGRMFERNAFVPLHESDFTDP